MTMMETERTTNQPEGPVDYLVWLRHPNHPDAGRGDDGSVLLAVVAHSIPEAIAKTRDLHERHSVVMVYVGIPVAGLPGTYR
jgi:hypothetical protein